MSHSYHETQNTGQEVGNSKKDFIRQVLVDDSACRACFYALIFIRFSRLIYVGVSFEVAMTIFTGNEIMKKLRIFFVENIT